MRPQGSLWASGEHVMVPDGASPWKHAGNTGCCRSYEKLRDKQREVIMAGDSD
jgi:hypothetical protein